MSEINSLAIVVMTLLSASVCVCLPRLVAEVESKLTRRRSLKRSTPARARSYSHSAPSQVHHPEASPELMVQPKPADSLNSIRSSQLASWLDSQKINPPVRGGRQRFCAQRCTSLHGQLFNSMASAARCLSKLDGFFGWGESSTALGREKHKTGKRSKLPTKLG